MDMNLSQRLKSTATGLFDTMVSWGSVHHLGSRWPALTRLYWMVSPHLKPTMFKVDGRWMEAHRDDVAITHALRNSGTYEPLETALLQASLAEGAVFLDIGANIGYHTLVGAERVGPSGCVVAIEPGRGNLPLLRRNITRNGFTQVRVLPVAAGDSSGTILLFESPDNMGDHRTYEVEGRQGYEVEVVRLSDSLTAMGLQPSVVKIDVQGFEFGAIRGLAEVLQATEKCVLFSEFWSEGLRLAGAGRPEDYYELLQALGFALFVIDEQSKTLTRLWGERERAFLSNDQEVNLLAVKGVAVDDLADASGAQLVA